MTEITALTDEAIRSQAMAELVRLHTPALDSRKKTVQRAFKSFLVCGLVLGLLIVLTPSCGHSESDSAGGHSHVDGDHEHDGAHDTHALPAVKKLDEKDWCAGHGVPESVCTRCNKELIAGFKAKGDWCAEHTLPESQCIVCHPELEATLAALAPKKGG